MLIIDIDPKLKDIIDKGGNNASLLKNLIELGHIHLQIYPKRPKGEVIVISKKKLKQI